MRGIKKLARRFTVVIDYKDLKNGKNLQQDIETAYGPKGHGILFVKDIPDYLEARRVTLPLFQKLANFPTDVLQKYTRPDIFHSLGWSCGKEKFMGEYDQSKGSFYLNCMRDHGYQIPRGHESQFSPEEKLLLRASNIWVSELPALQLNVKALAAIMIHTGQLLARQIDAYAQSKIPSYKPEKLSKIIQNGQNHVGRILHYFPFSDKGRCEDDWCGWHNDHGSLTALTSAMYLDAEGKEYIIKAASGGLYAKNRFAQMLRIAIPSDRLAFQLGESAQIHTAGLLEATPHCVVRNEEIAGKGVSRNTFAVFMQPDPLEPMTVPQKCNPQKVILGKAYKVPPLEERWQNGIKFKEFHKNTLQAFS